MDGAPRWHLLVLHGPNLNLLGEREVAIYGRQTLAELEARIAGWATAAGAVAECRQSNHEGVLIDWLHERRHDMDGLIINPGALGHYSWALRDAIAAIARPAIEVHLSDPQRREPFRRQRVLADVVLDHVAGAGDEGYRQAITRLIAHLGGGAEEVRA